VATSATHLACQCDAVSWWVGRERVSATPRRIFVEILTMITMMSGVRLQQVQSSTYLLVFVVQCDHSASCCVDAQSSDTLIHTSGSVRHRILHSLAQASPPIKRVLLSMAKTREVRLVLVSTRRQWCMKTRLLEHSRSRNRCQSHTFLLLLQQQQQPYHYYHHGIWSSYCRIMIRWFKLGWITPWQQSIISNGIFIFTSVDRCNFCFCLT